MEFFEVLVRYEIAVWSAVDQALTRQGELNLGQLHALRAIDRHDGRARVQELSTGIGITVGAVSKLVDRLERSGWVVRTPNPANRRSSLIVLTSAGRLALASGTAAYTEAVAAAIGDEDVTTLTAVLRRLEARLTAASGAVAA